MKPTTAARGGDHPTRADGSPIRALVVDERAGSSKLLNSRAVPIMTSSGSTTVVGPRPTVVALAGSDL